MIRTQTNNHSRYFDLTKQEKHMSLIILSIVLFHLSVPVTRTVIQHLQYQNHRTKTPEWNQGSVNYTCAVPAILCQMSAVKKRPKFYH